MFHVMITNRENTVKTSNPTMTVKFLKVTVKKLPLTSVCHDVSKTSKAKERINVSGIAVKR